LYSPPMVLAVLVVRHQKRVFKRRLREQAICTVCRYDLTGNASGVCPECGTRIVVEGRDSPSRS
jgi:rubrerythrin